MTDSLSILIPVRNAESSLAAQVEHLLDVLPELTPRFEILVIDDGSTDHTPELARELARAYPQLRLIRHTQPRGAEATIQTGLRWAQGQTVLVQEDPAALSATELRRLWSLRREPAAAQERVMQRPGLFDPELLERLTTWGQSLRHLADGRSVGSVQMVRRADGQAIAAAGVEGESHSAQISAPTPARADSAHAAHPRTRRSAGFLDHLRDLAVGE